MKAWTNDELDLLRSLWQQRVSATKIGKQMGRSRNSIIGKLYHLGLLGDQRYRQRVVKITLATSASG